MKQGKVRDTVRKSVSSIIGYRSFQEDHPNFSLNIDLKQQYIRGNCVGRNDFHEQTWISCKVFSVSNFCNLCCQGDRFKISFLKEIFTFGLSFFSGIAKPTVHYVVWNFSLHPSHLESV